jgi:hypothetical protein
MARRGTHADAAAPLGYPRAVPDQPFALPFTLPSAQATTLAAALDRERKIERALETLGPVAGRDVAVVGALPDGVARLASLGARPTRVESLLGDAARALPDGSVDTIVSAWSAFRGVDPSELAAAERLLRPGGRLLVLHDYGRDDVSRLRGDLPEYGAWSRRSGPFLANGFRVRVLHCFWTFDSLDQARSFLAEAFGANGTALGVGLKRPRLSYNVAVYHRTLGGRAGGPASPSRASEAGASLSAF